MQNFQLFPVKFVEFDTEQVLNCQRTLFNRFIMALVMLFFSRVNFGILNR